MSFDVTSPVSSSTSTSATQAAYEIAECGSTSTAPVSSSTFENGFSAAPVPVISSPYVHVAAPATSATEILRSGAPFARHLAVGDLEVARVDLELLRRDLEHLLPRPLRRVAHGVAADERAARGERTGADGEESVFETSIVTQS